MIDRINESLINLHINDPTRPINPLVKVWAIYYSVETAGKIQDILLSLDSNWRTECAIKVATNYKVRELIRYLPYYWIVDEENKFRLAYVCAKNNWRVTAREINKFEITSNEALFSIAKMCIKQNPRWFLEYTENFISLSDIQLKVLAWILLLKEPESFWEIHLFFNWSKPVERFLTVENIKNWVKENLWNELSEEIYRDSKRRDVGIRLLWSYLLSWNNENILTSKMMIENSTWFPASSLEWIEDKHSTEIYSSILDMALD